MPEEEFHPLIGNTYMDWNGRPMAFTVSRAPEPEPEPVPEPLLACTEDGCDERRVRYDMIRYRSSWWCSEHVQRCRSCQRHQRVSEMVDVTEQATGITSQACTACAPECSNCHTRMHHREMVYTTSGYMHRAEAEACEECGEWGLRGADCVYCNTRVRGLHEYGKTQPSMWLGGPLPKNKKGVDKGYYLGFELEVSASKGHVKVLSEWAAEAMGSEYAIECKQDSSVRGFEIATQPMTPEFFERTDWEGMFKVLNSKFPLPNRKRTEPVEHGLHVHIGKVAFAGDDIAMAAFCYLIGQSNHLERIARRDPTNYCTKVTKPVSAAIRAVNYSTGRFQVQSTKAMRNGISAERSAINLLNSSTIEIRAFRSTRKPEDLRDAVRLVYVAAEYIRYLRFSAVGIPPRSLHWTEFTKWVASNHPLAFESIAGIKAKPVVR